MRALLALGLAAAVSICACGSDSDDGDGDPSGASGGPGGSSGGECGGAPIQSCTHVNNDGELDECLEIFDASSQPVLDACAADEGATVSDDPCPRAGSEGGCQFGAGEVCYVVWGYDASDYQAGCEMLGGTYLPPPQ